MAALIYHKKWFVLVSTFIGTTTILLIMQGTNLGNNNKIEDFTNNYKMPIGDWRGLTSSEVTILIAFVLKLFFGVVAAIV